jgi:hypothetical protein
MQNALELIGVVSSNSYNLFSYKLVSGEVVVKTVY